MNRYIKEIKIFLKTNEIKKHYCKSYVPINTHVRKKVKLTKYNEQNSIRRHYFVEEVFKDGLRKITQYLNNVRIGDTYQILYKIHKKNSKYYNIKNIDAYLGVRLFDVAQPSQEIYYFARNNEYFKFRKEVNREKEKLFFANRFPNIAA